eukprot:14353181-Heterocapsa_arctica.AAC.1
MDEGLKGDLATLVKHATTICRTIAATAVLWPPLARGTARLPPGPKPPKRARLVRPHLWSYAG